MVRVAADADYIELMSRWAQWENGLEHQGCYTPTHHVAFRTELMRRFRCNIRMLQRSSRRALGLPASRDATTLAAFVKRVRESIESQVGSSVSTIAPAFPRLSPHAQEEVEEALSLTGLGSTRVQTGHGNTMLYQEANAAYAGLGHGLCEDWSFKSDCLSAAWPPKSQSTVYFNFDNASFSLGAMELRNAFQEHTTYIHRLNTSLGWWSLPVYDAPRAKFWEHIHDMIVNVLAPMSTPPNRIVLMGEHGADKEFQSVVQAAMWDQFEFDVESMLQTVKTEDAAWLAARGAAELGWRDEEFKREYLHGERKGADVDEL
ncbi:hypothetical protein ACEQ8H_001867 [Pleosporales sp. CAS-2024a]